MSQHVEYFDLINSYAAFDRENHLDIEPLERTPRAKRRPDSPAGPATPQRAPGDEPAKK